MRIVVTGGGTAGHVVPNFAVIDELKRGEKHEFLYIGSKMGVEKAMCEKYGIKFSAVECGKLRRYFSLQNFLDLFKVPVGIWEARNILKDFKADVLFSKGGFVGIPAVVAAKMLNIPIILHESDFIPGLANRLSVRFAKFICISFEESRKYFSKFKNKLVYTGNPVRSWLSGGDVASGYKFTGLDKFRPIILVMGGSQGALQINNLIREVLNELLKKFQIIHLCGKGNIDLGVHKKGYVQYEFLDEQMKDIYSMCDLVISRGGANSLAEIAYLKKKALIIPLGKESSRGDQIVNAREFSGKYGWAVLNGNMTSEDFIKGVELAFNNGFNRSAGFLNGSKEIAKLIIKTSK